MSEEKEIPAWRKRFLADRMAFESILFEKELTVQGKEKLSAGLAGALLIGLAASLLLAQWVLRQGYFFSAENAAGFQLVSAWSAHFKSGGIWSVFRPFSAGTETWTPPLYYLTYLPVIKFITGDMNRAMIAVNGLYLTVLSLAIFTVVKKNRNNASGWLGACFAMAMPAVMETARHPDHRLATMALAALVYAAYVNSEEFEKPGWSFWFGIFFGLGFFADVMFWVYILPLVPFVINGLTGYTSAGAILKGFLPGAILSLPWYAYFAVFKALGSFAAGQAHAVHRPGFWTYLSEFSGSAGLPLFLIGAAALVWMCFSAFMAYPSRKMIAAWLWVPFAVVYFLPGAELSDVYPALPAMAVAAAVMTPGKVRKYVTGFAVFLMVLNQSGLTGPVHLGRARIAGLADPSGTGYRASELIAELASRADPAGTSSVALVGEEKEFDHTALNFFSAKTSRVPLKFAVYRPETLGLADLVVYKTGAFGVVRRDGSAALARELARPWFSGVFSKAASLDLPDTSRLVIYAKNRVLQPPFAEKKHFLKNAKIAGLFMEEGSLELSGFDPSRGVYAKARLESRCATFAGFDIFEFSAEISDFSGFSVNGSVSDLRLTGAGAVRIASARVTSYFFERYIADKYPGLKNAAVSLDDTAQFKGSRGGTGISAEVSLASRPDGLDFRLRDLTYGVVRAPGFLLGLFPFKYDLSVLPYELSLGKIELHDQMLEIS